MKTKLLSLLIVFAAVFAFAVQPTRTAVDAAYETDVDENGVISSSTGYQSFIGTDSTVTLITAWKPEAGYQYFLCVDSLTGSGKDSVALAVAIDAKDNGGNKLITYAADTIKVADTNGMQIQLPVRETIIGNSYDVRMFGVAAHSKDSAVTVNRVYIYRRRPLNIDQNWNVGR